jgi:putative flippase GtrA
MARSKSVKKVAASKVPKSIVSFTRAQIASVAASIVDFGTLAFLTEVVHVYYVASTAIGALGGALTNFMIGRHWSFEAAEGRLDSQARRYALVSGISLGLNSLGVYVLTEYGGFKYMISKLITATLVGFLFNFPMHRSYVFQR